MQQPTLGRASPARWPPVRTELFRPSFHPVRFAPLRPAVARHPRDPGALLCKVRRQGQPPNTAIIPREPRYLPHLRREVTPERIVAQFGYLVGGPAERFEAPGPNALNFLIQDALSGGGMASLRIDPQRQGIRPNGLK